MTTATILSWVLATAPVSPIPTSPVSDSAPVILEADADEVTQLDGHLARWASVTYQLSTGQEAEAFVEVDERGRGDVLIYMDGEPLLHAAADEHGNIATWVAPEIDLPPAALAQLVSADVANEIFAGIGNDHLAGACSDSTKKWVKLAKYAWVGAIGVAAGVCCVGATVASGGAACVACTGLAMVAGAAGSDIADEYCG